MKYDVLVSSIFFKPHSTILLYLQSVMTHTTVMTAPKPVPVLLRIPGHVTMSTARVLAMQEGKAPSVLTILMSVQPSKTHATILFKPARIPRDHMSAVAYPDTE